MAVLIQSGCGDLFLIIITFKVTFVPNFSKFTWVDEVCYEDQFLLDVSCRFATQGHQIFRRELQVAHHCFISYSTLCNTIQRVKSRIELSAP